MIQISVIILTEGRGERLFASLETLTDQTLEPVDFEAILVAYMIEGLDEDLERMSLPFSCKVVRPANFFSSEALLRGVEEARGRFCLFLQEGQRAVPELLAEHLSLQSATGGAVGVGRVTYHPVAGSGWYARQYGHWQNQQAEAICKGESAINFTACSNLNFSAPRAAILNADITSNDGCESAGIELAFWLTNNGLRCIYIPGAASVREEHRSFAALARETTLCGASAVRLWRRHPEMLGGLFGHFYDTSLRGVILRRFLLWLGILPVWIGPIGPLLRDSALGREWFKFLHNFCYWYGVKRELRERLTWRSLTYGTPILMYHAFCRADERASRYILPQRRFAWQMALLKILGYHTITLEEYLEALTTYSLVPDRSLVITMDDGYRDNFELAFPVLHRLGFSATVFLVAGGLGKNNNWDQDSQLTGRPIISASQAHELQRAGISLGSHTCSHPTLTDIFPESWDEIKKSKVDLEHEFGKPVQTFAYPHGIYNPSILEQVKQAGYLGACGVERGLNTPAAPQFALYRSEILGTTSLSKFLVAVWMG